jgi:alcohol dehydrogenase (NADP+)
MKKFTLQNNDSWEGLGLGTWKSKPGEVKQAIIEAIKCGYKHIDCAAVYGNEKEIGEAFTYCFNNNLVKREDLWITSKLWNNSHKKEHVTPALKQTLADLQLDYLDLYIIHWPIAIKNETLYPTDASDYISLTEIPIIETWGMMEEAKKNGLTKHIGVSNFSILKLKDLYSKATIKPEVNQVELHPYLQQEELYSFCNEHNIILTGYAPLGSGDRSEGLKRDNEPSLLENNVVNTIAKKHNATAAQILISWHLHRGNTVIPKSITPERIQQNFLAHKLTLDKEDMIAIKNLDKHYRYLDAKFFEIPGNGYSNIFDE